MMHAMLGNTGSNRLSLEHDGKTYRVRLIDQEIQDAWEIHLYEKQCKAEEARQARLSPIPPPPETVPATSPGYLAYCEALRQRQEEKDRRENTFKDIREDLGSGQFHLLSPIGQRYMSTPAGMINLLALILDTDPTDAMALVVGAGEKVTRLLDEVLVQSFPGVRLPERKETKRPLPPGFVAAVPESKEIEAPKL